MDDMKDFDFNKLEISSNEIKEYDIGKPYPSYDSMPTTVFHIELQVLHMHNAD